MKATQKQLNCIELIRNKINYDDNCIMAEHQQVQRDLCLTDYVQIYPKIKYNQLTKREANTFISKWLDFSKEVIVRTTGFGLGNYDGWGSDNCDIFPTDMYY